MRNLTILFLATLGLTSCKTTDMTLRKVMGDEKKEGLRAETLNSAQYFLEGQIYLEWTETINIQNVENGKITVIDSTFKVRIPNGTKGELVEKINDPVKGTTIYKISFSKDHPERFIRFTADEKRQGRYYPMAMKWHGSVGKIQYGSSDAFMTGKESYLKFDYKKKELVDVTTEKGRDVKGKISTKTGESGSEEIQEDGSLKDQFEEK